MLRPGRWMSHRQSDKKTKQKRGFVLVEWEESALLSQNCVKMHRHFQKLREKVRPWAVLKAKKAGGILPGTTLPLLWQVVLLLSCLSRWLLWNKKTELQNFTYFERTFAVLCPFWTFITSYLKCFPEYHASCTISGIWNHGRSDSNSWQAAKMLSEYKTLQIYSKHMWIIWYGACSTCLWPFHKHCRWTLPVSVLIF